jgi:hypothetical protein
MNLRRTIAAASLTALALLLCSSARTAPRSPSEFLWISDLHFDPTVNPALVDSLADTDASDWARILASSPGRPSKFGEDTDWPLLASSLAEIRKVSQPAQFTIVTGDIFVHNFRQKFNRTAFNNGDEAFRRFTAKTFDFVAAQLADLIPGKPVLFTLGNNDSDCGDYELQPGGAFLKDTSAAVAKMLGPLADESSASDWAASGSYSVPHPLLKHYRVIALNSVYFSPRYRNACAETSAAPDPAQNEMSWLAAQLAAAKTHREKVWLLYHVAPGIDGYATAHPKGGGTEKRIVYMWKPEDNDRFQQLLEQYRDTVTISLAGHEHTDDFRLVNHSLVLLAPGLSPLVGQNPAFRLVTYRPGGNLTDATTYYLSNLDEFDTGAEPHWKPEYSFAQAWRTSRLDFRNFNKLYSGVQSNPDLRARWTTFYSVSHPEGNTITPETFPWLFCAAGNMNETSYNACLHRVQSQ